MFIDLDIQKSEVPKERTGRRKKIKKEVFDDKEILLY